MPFAIPMVAAAIVTVGGAGLAVPIIGGLSLATIAANVVVYGALLAASALTSPKPKKPQQDAGAPPTDGQQTIRGAVEPRKRHYGRVKIGGGVFWYESKAGKLYVGIMHGQGEIDAIEEHWLGDNQVTIDGSGNVLEAQYQYNGASRVKIKSVIGISSQLVNEEMRAAFPTFWTADHRLRGISHTFLTFDTVPQGEYSKMYPQGAPQYRQMQRGVKVFDPRDATQIQADKATWKWRDNPAICLLDYITSSDGARLNITRIYVHDFIEAANTCDEPVALKGGGTEKRYRLWGSYKLDEDPKDVIKRMCAVMDAQVYMRPDGKVGLQVGKWVAPTITINESSITSFNITQGNEALSSVNEIIPMFTSPQHDYQETEGQSWRDDDDISNRGQILSQRLDLYMCPSFAQARRLAKIAMHKQNPKWVGEITTNLYGLNCIGERIITVEIPELNLFGTFEIKAIRFSDDMTSAILSVSWLDQSAYSWNAYLEEGDAPAVPANTEGGNALPVPLNLLSMTEYQDLAAGAQAARAKFTWTPYTRDNLATELQYKKFGAADWLRYVTQPNEYSTLTIPLDEGANYEYRARSVSTSGLTSDWTATLTTGAITPSAPPQTPTYTIVNNIGTWGNIDSYWTNPAGTYYATKIYRNTTNSFAGATLIRTAVGAVTAHADYVLNVSDGTYTYYYWAVAVNASGGEASPKAPTPTSITFTISTPPPDPPSGSGEGGG